MIANHSFNSTCQKTTEKFGDMKDTKHKNDVLWTLHVVFDIISSVREPASHKDSVLSVYILIVYIVTRYMYDAVRRDFVLSASLVLECFDGSEVTTREGNELVVQKEIVLWRIFFTEISGIGFNWYNKYARGISEFQLCDEFAPHPGGRNDNDAHACEPNYITVQNKIITKILPVNKFTILKFLSLFPSMNG